MAGRGGAVSLASRAVGWGGRAGGASTARAVGWWVGGFGLGFSLRDVVFDDKVSVLLGGLLFVEGVAIGELGIVIGFGFAAGQVGRPFVWRGGGDLGRRWGIPVVDELVPGVVVLGVVGAEGVRQRTIWKHVEICPGRRSRSVNLVRLTLGQIRRTPRPNPHRTTTTTTTTPPSPPPRRRWLLLFGGFLSSGGVFGDGCEDEEVGEIGGGPHLKGNIDGPVQDRLDVVLQPQLHLDPQLGRRIQRRPAAAPFALFRF
jgi:hypothetical protein